MVERNYERVAVFEDDLRFEPYFNTRLSRIMKEVDVDRIEWDLMCVSSYVWLCDFCSAYSIHVTYS